MESARSARSSLDGGAGAGPAPAPKQPKWDWLHPGGKKGARKDKVDVGQGAGDCRGVAPCAPAAARCARSAPALRRRPAAPAGRRARRRPGGPVRGVRRRHARSPPASLHQRARRWPRSHQTPVPARAGAPTPNPWHPPPPCPTRSRGRSTPTPPRAGTPPDAAAAMTRQLDDWPRGRSSPPARARAAAARRACMPVAGSPGADRRPRPPWGHLGQDPSPRQPDAHPTAVVFVRMRVRFCGRRFPIVAAWAGGCLGFLPAGAADRGATHGGLRCAWARPRRAAWEGGGRGRPAPSRAPVPPQAAPPAAWRARRRTARPARAAAFFRTAPPPPPPHPRAPLHAVARQPLPDPARPALSRPALSARQRARAQRQQQHSSGHGVEAYYERYARARRRGAAPGGPPIGGAGARARGRRPQPRPPAPRSQSWRT
jgi:hypothetical protein